MTFKVSQKKARPAFTVSLDIFNWALEHIERYGDTDIFPVPFEFQAVRYCWDDLGPWLASQDMNTWVARPSRSAWTPKNKYGLRDATQLDPLDTIVYTALVYAIAGDIERARIPAESRVSFSNRFSPTADGRMFSPDWNWREFQEQSETLLRTGEFKYVLVADIADCFASFYHHPLENLLDGATSHKEFVKAIRRFLGRRNSRVSYGLPVGPSASALLAELALDSVDRVLLAEGATHCRYVDDFRIFCRDSKEAYARLELLARTLKNPHRLTLQQSKTRIVPVDDFFQAYLEREEDIELNALAQRIDEIIGEPQYEGPYGSFFFVELTYEQEEELQKLNLQDLLREKLDCPDVDYRMLRFLIRRLSLLDDRSTVDVILEKIESLYPLLRECVIYLRDTQSLSPADRVHVGKRLLDLVEGSFVCQSSFHRLWVLSLFSSSTLWNSSSQFVTLFNKLPDPMARRELLLALGRYNQHYWFNAHKDDWLELSGWVRRGFIWGASCLPVDARKHWFESVTGQLEHGDKLDWAVAAWAQSNPIVR